MPFKTMQAFPESAPGVERAPDVQMFFHGLLMLLPDIGGSQCQIGVHRLSVQHKLSVEVRVKGTEQPDPPLLRLAGSLDSQGLSIAIDPPTGNGISKFVGGQGEFDRLDETNAERDFRWSIDLQKLDPLQPRITIEQSGISPGIVIKDGLFYTARRTNPDNVAVQLTNPGNPVTPLNRVARIIGANIYLDAGERVILKWFGEGKNQTLALPKARPDHPALIYFDNSPSLMPSDKPDHSEFVEYFKVVTNATDVTRRFDLDFDLVGLNLHGTDRAPCVSVVVDG